MFLLTFISLAGVAAGLGLSRVREARVLTLVRRGPRVHKPLELRPVFAVLLFGLSPARVDGGLVIRVDEDPGPRVPDLAAPTSTSDLVADEMSGLLVSHQVARLWKGRSCFTSLTNLAWPSDLQFHLVTASYHVT